MLVPFVALLACASSPTPPPPPPAMAAQKPRVLVLDLEAVSVDKAVARSVDPIVLNAAAGVDGVEVIAQSEMKTIATVEAEKAQLGCDTSSCLAELAGAMGAQFVLFGSVSKLGDSTTVSLSFYDNGKGAIARESVTVNNVGALPKELPDRVRALVAKARGDGPVAAASSSASVASPGGGVRPAAEEESMGALGWAGVFGLVLGGSALLGGGVLATLNELTIDNPRALAGTKRAAQENGLTGLLVATGGAVVAGAGAVCLVLE